MKHGATWYKRVPADFLGGVQKLTDRQHAVYSVIIELVYLHGGECINDPKFIAGHFSNIGAAAARKTISELLDLGKISELKNGNLTQKRAQNEVKTRENARENASEFGGFGAKKRWGDNKNNDINIGTPKSTEIADKRREEKNIKEPPSVVPKKPPKPQKRATKIPDDFNPDLQPAIDEGLQPQEAIMSLARLKDHAQANGRTQIDWLASWRLWYRNDIAQKSRGRSSRMQANQQPALHPVIAEAERRKAERNAEHNSEQSRTIDHDRRPAEGRGFGNQDFLISALGQGRKPD